MLVQMTHGRRWREALLALGIASGFASAPMSADAQTTLTWGKPSEVLSTDPHLSGDGTSWTVFYLIYDQLMGTTDDLKPAPGLAEAWEEASPTSYLFRLRQNAKFSNGRPVTSADVVGSLKRLTDPKLGAAWGRQLKSIKDVVAVDERTVRIDLSEPLTSLLSILSVATTSILPIKEMETEGFDPAKSLMGSGPFAVKQHLQDEAWTLERNPHYWREGHPKADQLVIRIMPDDTTRIAALREGRVDFATFENPDTPRLLNAVPNVGVHIQKTPNYFRLDVSAIQETSPFRDDRLRKAMSYALDRQKIVQIVFGGNSAPEYVVPAAFDPPAACREHPSYTMPRAERVKLAKDLVRQAGAENQKINIIASSVLVTYPMIAQVIQRDLREIGLQAEIQQVPAAEWYQRVFVEKTDFHMAVSWFAGYSDPAMIMNWWAPGAAPAYAGFVKPVEEYGQVLDKVRTLPAGPERAQAMGRACEIVYEAANILPLVNKPDYIGFRRDLVDLKFAEVEGNFDVLKYAEEFTRKR
ncbi:MAG TPA: ABC transporter substrate-binding protein [Azospirillaceae bacterium]|nr:ABC transporter substrate-binding protein [Azospirillaceae bacterium]